MDKTLYSTVQWAQMEFDGVKLHDARYAKRLVRIAGRLAERPGGTLPQAFEGWAELKAAYRFFADPRNALEKIQSVHRRRVAADCKTPGDYLLIEDTTQLDFTGRCCEDLGHTAREGRGFFLHTTLAVRVTGWDLSQRPEVRVLGLFHQHCWNRAARSRYGKETRAQLQQRQRESDRWARALVGELAARQTSQCSYVYIADREADFYEPIQRCLAGGVDFLIRGYHHRRLADGSETCLEAVAKAPVVGTLAVELRARPAAAARSAVVEVRWVRVRLQGPDRNGRRMDAFTVNVLELREVSPPKGVQPLQWLLLTSLSCQRWSEIQRVIGRYCARWWVEEYHKALKSGVGVEQSQLEKQYRIESLVGVLAVVAVRLLTLKFLARARPDEQVDAQLLGATVQLLQARFGRPPEGHWTHRQLIRAVAQMGGFIARRSDGEPGWQTIWRGWQRLMWMAAGAGLIEHC